MADTPETSSADFSHQFFQDVDGGMRDPLLSASPSPTPDASPDASPSNGHAWTYKRFSLDMALDALQEDPTTALTGHEATRQRLRDALCDPVERLQVKMTLRALYIKEADALAALEFVPPRAAPRPKKGNIDHLQEGNIDPTVDTYTDQWTVEHFAARWADTLRYVPTWKTWMFWDRTTWQRDEGQGHVTSCLFTFFDELRASDALTEALAKHLKASCGATRMQAIQLRAQRYAPFVASHTLWDTHPGVLACLNGTLDLATGALSPHDPALFITHLVPVAFDPDATCPLFENFIFEIMDDNVELVEYLQRIFGYCLTGSTREEVFWLFHGTGQNGKSTLLRLIHAILGPLAKATDAETFMEHTGERISNDLARLASCRVATCTEIAEGKRLNEELVKKATGQDVMTARFLHCEFFDFVPQFKVLMVCNDLPRVRGTGKSIWRRIHRVPFSVTISDDQRDSHLGEKLLAELPGIFAWMVLGARLWYALDGLRPPDAVLTATAAYSADQDIIGHFLTECTVEQPQIMTPATQLYKAYAAWCDDSNERPMTQTAFGRAMAARGWNEETARRKHLTTGWVYLGMALKND